MKREGASMEWKIRAGKKEIVVPYAQENIIDRGVSLTHITIWVYALLEKYILCLYEIFRYTSPASDISLKVVIFSIVAFLV